MMLNRLMICGVALAFLTLSCKKDEAVVVTPAEVVTGCTDPIAENYNVNALTDNGSCTYISDKYIGTYTVIQECLYADDKTYTMEIVGGTAKEDIVLRNLDNDVDVRAKIDGADITFSEDKAGITYEGSGYLAGNVLTINMELCETFYYPCSSPESCSLTATK